MASVHPARPAAGAFPIVSRIRAFGALIALLLLTLTGCGGGGGESADENTQPQACDSASCGTVFVSMTDADGDFLSYTVDVVSLSLRKANGATVEILPVTTRIDFAQLVDLTEFLTAATVPNGVYVEGTIRLDYSNAEVTVEVNGEPRPAVVVGDDGQPLGVVDLRILLDNRNHLTVAPGRPSWLEVDFDLAASHSVDVSVDPAVAVAEPFVVASLEPVQMKEMRLRGALVEVDPAASEYTIDVRPFLHAASRFGRMTVHTTAETVFEINGETFTGAEGLEALAQLDAGSPTIAFGTLDRTTREFTAERVFAGTSVPGQEIDAVWGNVTARDGDLLTVRGATLIRRTGSAVFLRRDVLVQVGPDTKVVKEGDGGAELDASAISVGQRILAFGDVSESTDKVTLTARRVRLHITHLWGTVQSSAPGSLVLDLSDIDGRHVDIFDFAGTGATPELDADPAAYEVDTGDLNPSLLADGDPVRVFGFVTPFGAAPPDFEGRTIVDRSDLRALLAIGWGLTGTEAPFLALGADGIALDTSNPDIGLRHHIRIGPRLLDLQEMATPATIVPADGRTLFAIGEPGRVEVFADFGEFTMRLAEKLSGGSNAHGLTATGFFDTGTSVFTAHRVMVALSPAD